MNTLYAVAILAGVASVTLGSYYTCIGKGAPVAVLVGLVLIVAGIVGLLL